MKRLGASLVAGLYLLGACAWGEPAAWHISGPQGGDVWLLGSVHYLRGEDYPLPPNIDRLYEQADTLVMELDLDDLDALAVQGSFLAAAMLPADSSLQSVLSPSVYALAETQAAGLGLDLSLMAPFEPWLVAITLMDLGMNALGFSAGQGLEQYLIRRAAQDGKEILGLETLDDQVRVFDELSTTEQEALLLQTLTELDSADEAMDQLLDAWRDGRLDTLASELSADFDEFPGLYQSLVVNRNESWINTLQQISRDGQSYLVVVGALHLVGEGNVIDLLTERGMTVVPVDAR